MAFPSPGLYEFGGHFLGEVSGVRKGGHPLLFATDTVRVDVRPDRSLAASCRLPGILRGCYPGAPATILGQFGPQSVSFLCLRVESVTVRPFPPASTVIRFVGP